MKTIIIAYILLALFVIPAQASCPPPALPSSFYGKVAGAQVGETLTVLTGNAKIAWADIRLWQGMTVYSVNVPGDDPCTVKIDGAIPGSQIIFKVKNRVIGTALWNSGTNIQLDLAISRRK